MLSGQSASGNIYPSRFVKKSGAYTVAQSGAGELSVGISHEGAKATPLPGASTLAAEAGDPLNVYSDGDNCLLEAGADDIPNGAYLKSDSTGRGVVASSSDRFCAIAERGGSTGHKMQVLIKYGITP